MQNYCLSCSLFIATLKLWDCHFFWGVWKITNFDNSILSDRSLSIGKSHSEYYLTQHLCFFFSRIERDSLWENRFTSSAKRWKSKISEQQWKSFTYNKNNIGPSTDPCGIPQLTLQLVDVALLTITTCCRPLR